MGLQRRALNAGRMAPGAQSLSFQCDHSTAISALYLVQLVLLESLETKCRDTSALCSIDVNSTMQRSKWRLEVRVLRFIRDIEGYDSLPRRNCCVELSSQISSGLTVSDVQAWAYLAHGSRELFQYRKLPRRESRPSGSDHVLHELSCARNLGYI